MNDTYLKHRYHLGSQRLWTFLLWIGFSVFVHFGLTCALFHPIDAKPPQIGLERNTISVEASFIPQTPNTASQENIPEESIVESTQGTDAVAQLEPQLSSPPPENNIHDSNLSDRLVEKTPVFSSNTPLDQKIDPKIAPQHKQKAGSANTIAPSILKNPAPRYPAQARAAGQEGTVRLKVWVDGKGRPEKVELLQTSGYPLLDARAQETVAKEWRFSPGKQNGKPIAQTVNIAVTFRLLDHS